CSLLRALWLLFEFLSFIECRLGQSDHNVFVAQPLPFDREGQRPRTLRRGLPVAWPLVARAQQPAMPVIGYLDAGAPETSARFVAAFRKGLSETGYAEGRNRAIGYRWAYNNFDRLPELASDLVRRPVTVIAAMGGVPTALAAKAATGTVPIV